MTTTSSHRSLPHKEHHKSHRTGWLRAAVLGANDGIVSTASLVIGVASAHATLDTIMLSGVAGLVAGAMSMAAGEYVSVSSQADTEYADLELEKHSLKHHYAAEQKELAVIYENRGLSAELALQVAEQLMSHDALGAHARDEIGLVDEGRARPIQASLASALTFTVGALLPLITAYLSPLTYLPVIVALLSLVFLASLGGLAAYAGGASVTKGVIRVTFWGALAMVCTGLAGTFFDTLVA